MSRFDPLNGYIECIFIVGNKSVALMVGYNVSIIIFDEFHQLLQQQVYRGRKNSRKIHRLSVVLRFQITKQMPVRVELEEEENDP